MVLTLLIIVMVTALVFEYINGFHDSANAIATVAAWNRANAARGHATVPRIADDALLTRLTDER